MRDAAGSVRGGMFETVYREIAVNTLQYQVWSEWQKWQSQRLFMVALC